MTRLTIDLTPSLEQKLEREASARGLSVGEYAQALLEGRALLPPAPMAETDAPANLAALAASQGAPLAARFEDLLGDFWPEEESADEFNAAVRDWRREGSTE